MPDQVVILFMFAVVTSFGIIWIANEMRLRFQARYLEYCFYFTLVTVAYGFVNWIAPFIVLYVTDAAGGADLMWSVAVFVLLGVPLVLAKLYLFVLMFQELLARRNKAQVLGRFASPFGLLFLIGYAVYVFTAYSAFLSLRTMH
jgi:hypothetical protein